MMTYLDNRGSFDPRTYLDSKYWFAALNDMLKMYVTLQWHEFLND